MRLIGTQQREQRYYADDVKVPALCGVDFTIEAGAGSLQQTQSILMSRIGGALRRKDVVA
jgi:hypothetical protein